MHDSFIKLPLSFFICDVICTQSHRFVILFIVKIIVLPSPEVWEVEKTVHLVNACVLSELQCWKQTAPITTLVSMGGHSANYALAFLHSLSALETVPSSRVSCRICTAGGNYSQRSLIMT